MHTCNTNWFSPFYTLKIHNAIKFQNNALLTIICFCRLGVLSLFNFLNLKCGLRFYLFSQILAANGENPVVVYAL